MPVITVTVSNNAETLPQTYENAVLILGKNRNFIKNELQKNINIFKTRIFTDSNFLGDENIALKQVIIVAGDDSAKAIETAILCHKAQKFAVIISVKPLYGVHKFAGAVITAENTELAECVDAVSQAKTLSGSLRYIYGVGETALSAAAAVFSKLPADFSAMKIYTNADLEEARELFSLVSDTYEIVGFEDDFDGVWFNVFLG
jgi:hypothetical protein